MYDCQYSCESKGFSFKVKLTDTILTDQDDVFLPDAEVVAEAADGGEEGDDDDDRGDDGGDVRVRGPLVRRVQAGVRALACNQGLHRQSTYIALSLLYYKDKDKEGGKSG